MSNDKYILESFDRLVNTLNETHGTNSKIELLKQHPDLVPLIKRIWDPNTTTGVTKKGLEEWIKKKGKSLDDVESPASMYELFDDLTARRLTGDRAKMAIWKYVEKYPQSEDLILRILEKKPRIRLASATILKAFPGIFTIFKVCLAEDYDEDTFQKELKAADGKAFLSKKIDGVRTITIVKKDEPIRFYSRTGNEITSLGNLRRDFESNIVQHMTVEEIEQGTVFDGELIALDADGRENFKETVSQVRKKDITMHNPRYMIFDKLTLSEFREESKSAVLSERLTELQDLFKDCESSHAEILEQTSYTPEVFEALRKRAKREKWEGIMIRFNQPYEAKRTKRLLKYKFVVDEEYRVEDITIEDMPFPDEKGGEVVKRALKNVTIMHKNCPVNVGSGFDAEERVFFAKHPEKIKGKIIAVRYQEEFQDKKTGQFSLRCPIFKALIGDERTF